MNKLLLLVVMLGFLSACAARPTVVISDTPKYDSYRHSPVKAKRPGKEQRDPQVQQPQIPEQRNWDISEDRFITTHSVEMSSEALGISKDEIKRRLKELDKK
jgi:hypothetical protein